MSVIEKAVQWALNIASDNSHGYSQNVRWGPSYDCSSLVITAFRQAGIPLTECTYTGNMKYPMIRAGFEDVTDTIELASGSFLKRGDVLLNTVHHTAIYIGNGQIVHARSSEGTDDTFDNSGNEIRTQSYYNYPWDCVLRYMGATEPTDDKVEESASSPVILINTQTAEIQNGSKNGWVWTLQTILNALGYDCGIADGEFGPKTKQAVTKFQTDNDLEVDGIAGVNTWKILLKGRNVS